MTVITKVKTANREEWKALRSHHIGGSDAAAVAGLNPFSSRYSLWAEKTGRVPGFEGNLATEVGAYLQEFVAKKFEAETGKRVRRANRSFLNSAYPWAIANIDREIVGESAGLEIQTTGEMNLKRFRGGDYPAQYYAQMVHYLAVTGKARWYLAVLIGNRAFRWFVLERDEGEIAALMEAERDFWRLVERDTPPEADGMEATAEAISAMYPESAKGSVDLFIHRAQLARYIDLGERIRELEAFRDEAANIVKAYMGSAERGECDGFTASWKSSVRGAFDAKRFMKDHPEMDCSDYCHTSSTRVFRVTKNG